MAKIKKTLDMVIERAGKELKHYIEASEIHHIRINLVGKPAGKKED